MPSVLVFSIRHPDLTSRSISAYPSYMTLSPARSQPPMVSRPCVAKCLPCSRRALPRSESTIKYLLNMSVSWRSFVPNRYLSLLCDGKNFCAHLLHGASLDVESSQPWHPYAGSRVGCRERHWGPTRPVRFLLRRKFGGRDFLPRTFLQLLGVLQNFYSCVIGADEARALRLVGCRREAALGAETHEQVHRAQARDACS